MTSCHLADLWNVWCLSGFLEHVRHCVGLMLGFFFSSSSSLIICSRKAFVDGWHDFFYEPVIEDFGGVLIAWFKFIWLLFVVYANTHCQCEQILSLCKPWKKISGKNLWLSSDNTLAICADVFWRCEACPPTEDWHFETALR